MAATLTAAGDTLYIATQSITCPYCWQTIDIALDLSVSEQEYVEDCRICCRPIVVRYRVEADALADLDIARES